MFMDFIPKNDGKIIETALNNFDNVDIGDLIDALESFDCRKYPASNNIRSLIEEIAHKEIVQKPKFVTDCWRNVFQSKLQLDFKTISKIYEEMRPTIGKVLKALDFPDTLDLKEQLVAGYLKKFIKTLDDKDVQNFLRFCTGSNLSCDRKIKIEFTRLTGFQRRPTSRTCNNVLYLPSTYETPTELSEEFMTIFRGNFWDMDYI